MIPAQPAWRHPYDFRAASALFVDAWPADWQALAPPHVLLPLKPACAHALGAHSLGNHDLFMPTSPLPLAGLCQQIDAALAGFGDGGFVRLSSRSPKDSLRAMRHGLRVTNGRQALALFLEGSRRCAEDLRMSLDCMQPLEVSVPLLDQLRSTVATLAAAAVRPDAVFDLLLRGTPGRPGASLLLLDANPLWPITGLGCFESAADLDGSLRRA